MTAQMVEMLHYRGREYAMWSCPSLSTLDGVIDFGGFAETNTALRRGYYGTWSIEEGRLFLTEIHGVLIDGRDVTLELLVPGCGRRAFAKGFSGNLDCPLENADHEFRMCTKFLRLHVERGAVVSEEELDGDVLEREYRERWRPG